MLSCTLISLKIKKLIFLNFIFVFDPLYETFVIVLNLPLAFVTVLTITIMIIFHLMICLISVAINGRIMYFPLVYYFPTTFTFPAVSTTHSIMPFLALRRVELCATFSTIYGILRLLTRRVVTQKTPLFYGIFTPVIVQVMVRDITRFTIERFSKKTSNICN